MKTEQLNYNTCRCSGNNSIRLSIGQPRCECGMQLTDTQLRNRIISRLNECSDLEDLVASLELNMIKIAHAAGVDRCEVCQGWSKVILTTYDHCICLDCAQHRSDEILNDEDLNQEEWDGMAEAIVRFLANHGLKVARTSFRKELDAIYSKLSTRD